MAIRQMRIHGMRPCPCERHAWVVLEEIAGGQHVRLRVQTDLVPWFVTNPVSAEPPVRVFDWVARLAELLGHESLAVVVTPEARHLSVRLRLFDEDGGVEIESEAGIALLAAQHIGLPIFLREDVLDLDLPAPTIRRCATAIPEVFHETLTHLGLLGDAAC
ncbi:MAG: hypothetical protein O3A10_07155 [Chloroflexi bacterium]|nr:hypothetical protein [Chloroflexota bacterium]MDA1146079.1 hypothetical protein [Chloroflexota bacterium]